MHSHCGPLVSTLELGGAVVVGALIVLVMSLLGGTMVVVMAIDDVGVGQNIVEVNVEGQLSFTVVAV